MGHFRQLMARFAPCCFSSEKAKNETVEMGEVKASGEQANSHENNSASPDIPTRQATRPQIITTAPSPLLPDTEKKDSITPISQEQSVDSSSRPVSDPDEITPAPPPGTQPGMEYSTRESMYTNVTQALIDRERLFKKLRTPQPDPMANVKVAELGELEAAREKAMQASLR